MPKTILITGATDGIGRATAEALAGAGHDLLLHGRSADKLSAAARALQDLRGAGNVDTFEADLSDLEQVVTLVGEVRDRHGRIDVLINNAGVFRVDQPVTPGGEDLRFVVNTFAPALLTRLLLPAIPAKGRIVHLSSAAQAPVDLAAMTGKRRLEAMDAYAQSKRALTLWSAALAQELGPDGPVTVAVNPGSLLATNMVRKGFGVAGSDVGIGVDILRRAALSDNFAGATGRYYDNDSGRFAQTAGGTRNSEGVVAAIEDRISKHVA